MKNVAGTSFASGEFGLTQEHKHVFEFKKLSNFKTLWKFFQISEEIKCICLCIVKLEQMYMKSYPGRF